MRYDINTIGELINALGGPSETGCLLGLSASAVCNWESRQFIPPSWHVRLLYELKMRSMSVDPALFEATDEQFAVLFPSKKRASPAPFVAA
jgi:hypothetical protein